MRLYKPDNATVLKGALRNLLDGSKSTSIKHFINKAETIHQNFFDDYDAYDMDGFLPLYKHGATLVYIIGIAISLRAGERGRIPILLLRRVIILLRIIAIQAVNHLI